MRAQRWDGGALPGIQRVLALATAVLLVVAGGVLLGGFSGGRAGDPSPDGGEVAAAATTTTAPPVPDAVRRLQDFVAEQRGLDFKADVAVTLLEDEPFEARLLADVEQDREQVALTGRVLHAVGLLDADIDLFDVLLRFLGSAVVGFYAPETDELVVRGGELTPYRRATLVHELTHALDDQWFDLHRPELSEGDDDERSLAFSALVEGDAVRVEAAYRRTLGDADRMQLRLEEQELAGRIDVRDLPPVLPRIIGFPYLHGPDFVAALLTAGGEELVNRTFERPPLTSEHILDPASWLDGELVQPVGTPEAEGPVLEEGVYGQASLQLTLEPVVGAAAAARAADGWGGDRYVVWDEGGRTCVRATFAMDTAADLDELTRELRAWAEARDVSVERQATTAGFTSCS